MGEQAWCRYCGEDTRFPHLESCPQPELTRLDARVDYLETRIRVLEDIAGHGRVATYSHRLRVERMNR